MRKLVFTVICLGILAAVAFFVWKSKQPADADNRPVLVTSGYVPYTLAKELAGEHVNVQMLLPPGAEPHAFEPTPGVLIMLQRADAFVYVSDELEPWAADLSKSVGEHTRVVALAKSFPQTGDPHIWMNPKQADLMAHQIAALLVEIAPQLRPVVDKNYLELAGELDRLDQDYKAQLANCKLREVVHIGHLAFKNLADAYGLTLTALAGTSHEGEHSAKKLAGLVDEIKTKQIPAIFTEDTLSPRLAQTVAQETGAQVLPLYPIEHISKQDFKQNVTYVALMRRNLESLKRGLLCQA